MVRPCAKYARLNCEHRQKIPTAKSCRIFLCRLVQMRAARSVFGLCTENNKEFDRQNQVALSERLGAGLRRKGCDAYLNGTRAFREVQRCPNEPLKAAKRAAPQSERGTKNARDDSALPQRCQGQHFTLARCASISRGGQTTAVFHVCATAQTFHRRGSLPGLRGLIWGLVCLR